jgi:hypothetical protein
VWQTFFFKLQMPSFKYLVTKSDECLQVVAIPVIIDHHYVIYMH